MISNKTSADAVAKAVQGLGGTPNVKQMVEFVYHLGRADGLIEVLTLESNRVKALKAAIEKEAA